MLSLVRRPVFWLIVLGVVALGSTGLFVSNQAKTKKAAAVAAAAKAPESPFAAIANGKAEAASSARFSSKRAIMSSRIRSSPVRKMTRPA